VSAIQQNRWDQLLRRAADLKGPGSKVNDALTELFPTFDVEHLPAELYLLGGTRLCFGSSTSTGAAGESGRVQLFNPVGSGKLLTVTSFIASAASITIIRFGVTLTPLAAVSTQLFRDTREIVPALPTGVIGGVSSVALAPATGQFRVLANTAKQIEDPNGIMVLAPGTGLEVGSSVNQIAMNCTFFWRERVAEPSEINF